MFLCRLQGHSQHPGIIILRISSPFTSVGHSLTGSLHCCSAVPSVLTERVPVIPINRSKKLELCHMTQTQLLQVVNGRDTHCGLDRSLKSECITSVCACAYYGFSSIIKEVWSLWHVCGRYDNACVSLRALARKNLAEKGQASS